MVFIPGLRLAQTGRTNGGGGGALGGGRSEWMGKCAGGGINDACQVSVGLLCVEWFAHFSLSV
jgi:hypothetical protein